MYEERSDELRESIYGISTPSTGTFKRHVAAANSDVVSNAVNKNPFATRFACRSWIPEEIRQRQVRRDLAVAKTNVETTIVRHEVREATTD